MPIEGTVSIAQTDLSSITIKLDDLNNRIEQNGRNIAFYTQLTATRVSDLGDRIDGVANAVANMKMVLDTGVIAGAVDQRLGTTLAIKQRTGNGGR